MFTSLAFAENKQMLDKVVAVVNDSVITASELDAKVALTKKQYSAQRMELPQEAVLRKQVLQHLIDENLQLQLAKQHGVTVDSTELNEAISRVASANHLDVTQLRNELAKEGVSWQDYRNNFKKDMIIAKVQQQAVSREVRVTNEQVDHYLKTAGRIDTAALTYHIQNIVIPLGEEPSPAQLAKAQKKANEVLKQLNAGADFTQVAAQQSTGDFILESSDLGQRHLAEMPELFAKAVVSMKVGQVSAPIRAPNGLQLIKLVAINGDKQKHIVTKTHVRHILLKPEANMLPEEALKQVNNVHQQLKSGIDFAAMAKKHSLDTASAVKGGDLGWVSPGELVPEFEKAMDKLAINEVSKPVKTQYGWHLIQVLERQQKDDSEAFKKQQVRQFLQQRKFMEAVQNWQQHIRTDAYVNIVEKELA